MEASLENERKSLRTAAELAAQQVGGRTVLGLRQLRSRLFGPALRARGLALHGRQLPSFAMSSLHGQEPCLCVGRELLPHGQEPCWSKRKRVSTQSAGLPTCLT